MIVTREDGEESMTHFALTDVLSKWDTKWGFSSNQYMISDLLIPTKNRQEGFFSNTMKK